MNVIIVTVVIVVMLAIIGFLISRKCWHSWKILDRYDNHKYTTYIQQCTKCGCIRTKKLKVR